MKKIFKNAYIALIGLMAAGFSSCSGDDIEYTPAEQIEGMQVYFSSSNASSITLSSQETTFDIAISRIHTSESATVSLNVTDESGLYSIPSSVSFASGEAKANITVSYDPEEVGFDNYSTITISIADDSYKTPYGTSEYTVKVGIPSPWTTLGKATYSDSFMFEDSYQVELQQNDLDKNLFRLVRPYREGLNAEGYGGVTGEEQEYPEFRLLQPGDEWKGTTVTQEGLVAYNDISTEWNNTSYGATIWLLHPSRLTSMAEESYWTYNKVLSYQENGLPAVIQLAPYYYMFGVGGWNKTQENEWVTIVFPGVVMLDASVEVAYTGMFTSADDEIFAVANVLLGEDVESAKVALLPSSKADIAVDGIIDGSIESVEMTASGEVKVAMPADADEGKFVFVVVTFANGEAQKSESTTFKYTPANAEKWTLVGSGDYTYDAFIYDYVDEGLELFRSESNPNLYKIEHWGYDVDFKFTYDQTTGDVLVLEGELGTTYQNYGMIYYADYSTYAEDSTKPSYYENGVFYFNVSYYVEAGHLVSNYETFALSPETSSVSSRAMKQSKSVNKSLELSRNYTWRKQVPIYSPIAD